MPRLFTIRWFVGITIALLGVTLVRLVAFQMTGQYQLWVSLLGYVFSGLGLTVIAWGIKRASDKAAKSE